MRREDIVPAPAYEAQSDGFARAALIDRSTGSVHMGLGLCALDDGQVDLHVHSFEESFYVLEGAPVLYLDGHGVTLLPRRCGVVPVGVQHAWRAEGGRATWIDMMSPQPRRPGEGQADTFFLGPAPSSAPSELDVRDPRNREPVPARGLADGSRRAEEGCAAGAADRLGEHGDGAARLQRDRGEDARRPAARRASAHDVHGRIPRDRSGAAARPPLRGVVLHARGRGRRGRGRRALHASPRRRLLDGRRLHPRLLQHARQSHPLARDVGAGTARPPLVPLQPRLGVPRDPAGGRRRDEAT